MESSRRLVIMLAIGVVLVFGIIAIRSMRSTETAPAVPPTRVIIAKRDIPQGTTIQPLQDFDWMPIEPEKVTETMLKEGTVPMENFTGAIVRRQLKAGEPVTASALSRAGEGGFMAAVLEPGMRAVSIAVSATSGNAGFISPGDRVDLVVTHRIHTDGSTSNTSGTVISDTFVRDVRVLAVDQTLENPENQAILAKTITVEATSKQAEQISVAADLGKISVMLRSASPPDASGAPLDAAHPSPERKTFTSDADVSPALGSGGLSSTIRVIRGDQVENVPVH
jgi:pilus assembly protein CpaB